MSKLVVVIDMQNDFIDGSLGSEDAKAIVPKACAAIKHYAETSETELYITQDCHDKDFYSHSLEGKLLPVPHCLFGENGFELNRDIKNTIKDNFDEERILIGIKISFGINWFDQFDYDSYDEIIIFGLCTDICVVSNALIFRAAYPNTPIKCLAYCCAGTTPEAHEAALKVMESCQIEVIREEGEY